MRPLLPALTAVLLAACGDEALPPASPAPEVLQFEGQPMETAFDEAPPPIVDLAGPWQIRRDPAEEGIAARWFDETTDRSGWDVQAVPGTWNVTPEGEMDLYEGPAFLARSFELPQTGGQRVLLRFGACFLQCRFWLNGVELAQVERPYLPIAIDATDAAREGNNLLVVRADNRITATTVPVDTSFNSGRHGWWPFGGLTRAVGVELASPVRLFEITALPELSGEGEDRVALRVGLVNAAGEAPLRSLRVRLLDPSGRELKVWQSNDVLVPAGPSSLTVEHGLKAERWNRQNPALYSVEATLDGDAQRRWVARFGFRTVGTTATHVLLNGEPSVLYGISRHEDDKTLGPWQPDAHLEEDLALLKELNVNHIRPGHYPADERWLRMLRDAGITMQEEIPVYQWNATQMADRALIARAVEQLEAMIQRDRNNPAIIAWSLMNEVHSWEPSASRFTQILADRARALTPDRLTTYSLQAVPAAIFPKEYAGQHVEVIGINEYYLWYYGDIPGLKEDLRMFRERFLDKPMVITEFGGDALLGKLSPEPLGPEPWDDHSYSENWQVWMLEQHLQAFRELGFIGGVMPWAFADFRMEWSPPTAKPMHPGHQMNFKGLLTLDRQKKQSFGAIKAAYEAKLLGP